MPKGDSKNKDWWDKAQIIGTISIPLIIGLAGYFINNSIKNDETHLKYIELAIGILREEPNKDTAGLRSWAIDVLSEYPEVKFTNEASKELKTTALPYKKVLIDGKGNIITDGSGNPLYIFEK